MYIMAHALFQGLSRVSYKKVQIFLLLYIICSVCVPPVSPNPNFNTVVFFWNCQCNVVLFCHHVGKRERNVNCSACGFFFPKPGWGNCLYISQCNLKKRYHTCRLSGCDSQTRTRLSYRYTVEEVLQKRSMKQCTCTLYSALSTFVYVP